MNLKTLFSNYYVRFRGDSVIPNETDPEYLIFTSYANEAIGNWATVPDLLWSQLWNTLQSASDGDKSYTTTKHTYLAPSDMQRPGGFVRLTGSATATSNYNLIPVINPSEVQVQAFNSTYAFFTGDPNDGFTLNLYTGNIPAGQNYSIDYPYYSQATLLTNDTSTPQMSDPSYIVDWALAQRYLNSNLVNKYQIMDASATQKLADMVNVEFSGTNYNKTKLRDPLGGGFGTRSSNIGQIRL